MKISIHLKHLIIPFIVCMITITTMIYNNYDMKNNSTQLNISFLYTNNSIDIASSEKNIWNALRDVQESRFEKSLKSPDVQQIRLDYIQANSSGDMSTKLKNYSENSDVIVVIGNEFNEYLDAQIKKNISTKYILINNEQIFDYKNTVKINYDYRAIINDINQMDSNGIMYISLMDKESNVYFKYLSEQSKDPLHYIRLNDVNDVSILEKQLNEYYTMGADKIIVEPIALNEVVLQELEKLNNKIKISIEENSRLQVELNKKINDLKSASISQSSIINQDIILLESKLANQVATHEIKLYSMAMYDLNLENADYEILKKYDFINTIYKIDPTQSLDSIINKIISGDFKNDDINLSFDSGITKIEYNDLLKP